MQTPLSQTLQSILTIACYPYDKAAFAKEFEMLNMFEAILRVYNTLSQAEQNFINEHPEDYEAIIGVIPKEAYYEALLEVRVKALQGLLKQVSPTLSVVQRKQINNLIIKL